MSTDNVYDQLQALLTRVDGMHDRVRRLTDENRSLRQQHSQLRLLCQNRVQTS